MVKWLSTTEQNFYVIRILPLALNMFHTSFHTVVLTFWNITILIYNETKLNFKNHDRVPREVFADLCHDITKMDRVKTGNKADAPYLRHQFQYHLQLGKVIRSLSWADWHILQPQQYVKLKQVVRVIWQKAAPPPHMDGSIVFARWRKRAAHVTHASLGASKPTAQTASRSVQPF